MIFRFPLQIYLLGLKKWKPHFSTKKSLSLHGHGENLIKLREFHKIESDQDIIPLFKKTLLNKNDICITDFFGHYSYMQLFKNSERLSRQISNICGSGSSSTVAFFSDNNVISILILWASWMSGQVVMPLIWNKSLLLNSALVKANNVKLILAPDKFEDFGHKLAFENNIAFLTIEHSFLQFYQTNDPRRDLNMVAQNPTLDGILLNAFYNNSGALLFNEYNQSDVENLKVETILQTHRELNTLMNRVVQTWHISENDRVLNVTPFHCYCNQFIYNILFPLSAGCQLHMLNNFDGKSTWNSILGTNVPLKERVNVLIAEPRVYKVLIQEYYDLFAKDTQMVKYIRNYCSHNFRLMISSCDRLDPLTFSVWMKITGHTLLEDNPIIYRIKIHQNNNVYKFLTTIPTMKIRVVDANNNILLESDIKHIKNPKTIEPLVVVGRLMTSQIQNGDFSYTGKVISYSKGILKIMGQHCNKN